MERKAMRPPYENVYIGTFIFTLGYMFGAEKKGIRTSAAIELYQQTLKGERLVGDLLTSVDGKCLIIEFKRDAYGFIEEARKKSKKNIRKMLHFGDKEIKDISRRCHFVSAGLNSELHKKSALGFMPYISLISNKSSEWPLIPESQFCKNYISQDNFEYGIPSQEFDQYVKRLSEVTGDTCGGLAISIDKNGLQGAVVFDDIRELSLQISTMEKSIERSLEWDEPSYDMEM